MRLSLWISIFLLLVSIGCRKETDTNSPNIEFELPGNSFTAQLPTSFTVRVKVTDDKALESLSVMIVDDNSIPIAPGFTTDLNGTSATIERDLSITDERILSGTYKLLARAYDGTNEERAFRSINILEAPLRLRAVHVAPPIASSPAVITRIDSIGVISTFVTVNEFYGAAIDSYSQHLHIAGGQFDPMIAYPTSAASVQWQVNNSNAQPFPYYTGLDMDPTDRRLYVCSNDQFIKGFSGNGTQQFTAVSIPDFRPYRTLVLGSILVSEQRSNTLPQRKLVTYASSSGALYEQWPLDLDLIDIYKRTDQTFLTFGNRNGDGVIAERHATLGGTFEMQIFSGSAITATTRIDNATFVLAVAGELKRFDVTTGVLTTIAAQPADAIAYEAAGGYLFVGYGDQLLSMDPSNGSILGSATIPTTIGKILPLYNR